LNTLAKKYDLPAQFLVTEFVTFDSRHEVVSLAKGLPPSLSKHKSAIEEETNKYFMENRETNIRPFQNLLRGGFDFSLSVGE